MDHFFTRLNLYSVYATLILRIFLGGERAGSSVHEDEDPVLQPGAAAGGDQAVLHQGEDTSQCSPFIQVLLRGVSRISFSVGDPCHVPLTNGSGSRYDSFLQ
jgi:hypothetical protein